MAVRFQGGKAVPEKQVAQMKANEAMNRMFALDRQLGETAAVLASAARFANDSKLQALVRKYINLIDEGRNMFPEITSAIDKMNR